MWMQQGHNWHLRKTEFYVDLENKIQTIQDLVSSLK